MDEPKKNTQSKRTKADIRPPAGKSQVIPCAITSEKMQMIDDYRTNLLAVAYQLGSHGLSKEQFEASGIFHAAVEQIRGTTSASMADKRAFVKAVLAYLKGEGRISGWTSSGSRDRHDFEIQFSDGRTSVVEMKGCLDGDNTNIFTRPPNADEFVIWSLCQNAGSNMGHNAWSGIHTRLGPEIISEHKQVDGLVIWDMLCGTDKRPCPKLISDPSRGTKLANGVLVPPPCIYVFPRTIPDYRNNPFPQSWKISEVRVLDVLRQTFKCLDGEIIDVRLRAGHNGSEVTRVTHLFKSGVEIARSNVDAIKRARG